MPQTTEPHLPSRTMPACTIIPVLSYPDMAEALDWLNLMFGFRERWRVGNHRAQLSLGEDTIAISEAVYPSSAYFPKPALHSLMIRVADLQSHYQHVKQHGGMITQPPADMPYGERQYTVTDIGGHSWTLSQTITDLAPEDWGGTSR